MGGYAFNVWAVYALFALFVAVNLILPMRKRKQIFREQKRRLQFNNDLLKDEIKEPSGEGNL